jgi:hypothetical protein
MDRGEAIYHPTLNLTLMPDNVLKEGDIYFIQGQLLLATDCKQNFKMLLKQKSNYISLCIVTTHYKWSKIYIMTEIIIIILPLKLLCIFTF